MKNAFLSKVLAVVAWPFKTFWAGMKWAGTWLKSWLPGAAPKAEAALKTAEADAAKAWTWFQALTAGFKMLVKVGAVAAALLGSYVDGHHDGYKDVPILSGTIKAQNDKADASAKLMTSLQAELIVAKTAASDAAATCVTVQPVKPVAAPAPKSGPKAAKSGTLRAKPAAKPWYDLTGY